MIYDVLIVGLGPVGATTANLLARRGLRVGVVESEFEIYNKPRALTFDHEVMRIFQACGLADRIAEFTTPHPGTHYLGVDGRVIKKVEPSAPHAVLLVLDATVGQNALSQVEIFSKLVGVTGLVMTKLDGTARGGILVAIAQKFALPIHFIGVGESVDDLAPFSARDFARAIAGLDS